MQTKTKVNYLKTPFYTRNYPASLLPESCVYICASFIKTMKKTLITLGAIALLASCSIRQTTPARSFEIQNSRIISVAKIADYTADMTKKVEGSSTGQVNPPSKTLDFYKEQAIADACLKSNCDFLINPTYDIVITGRRATVMVKGYAAKYTSLRDIVPSDTLHIKLNSPSMVIPNGTIGNFLQKQRNIH